MFIRDAKFALRRVIHTDHIVLVVLHKVLKRVLLTCGVVISQVPSGHKERHSAAQGRQDYVSSREEGCELATDIIPNISHLYVNRGCECYDVLDEMSHGAEPLRDWFCVVSVDESAKGYGPNVTPSQVGRTRIAVAKW